MAVKSPLRGLPQIELPADDVAKARDWFAEFLDVRPYFQRPDEETPVCLG